MHYTPTCLDCKQKIIGDCLADQGRKGFRCEDCYWNKDLYTKPTVETAPLTKK